MKIYLLTEYVDNIFVKLERSFPNMNSKTIKRDYKDNKFLNYLIIENNNTTIGYLAYELLYDRIEIDNIEILKEHRRKGYSNELMQSLINEAYNHKCINITLEVNEINLIAINLYAKFNFKNMAIRKNYYGNNNAILMERKMK